jgi:uncharacterized protein DUF4381
VKPDVLDRLHGFYHPAPPPWTPQTTGWYCVFVLLALLAGWMAWRAWLHWHRNRYRRAALRELASADGSAIPALLKRTALAAWPREEVASLSGEDWLQFLDTHGTKNSFMDGPGRILIDLEYRGAALNPEEERTLRTLADKWIRSHRVHA